MVVEVSKIYRLYTSILNLLQRESIAVPVEDQCKLVFGTCPTPTSHQTPFCLVPSRNLQSYFCANSTARPFVFLGLLPWLDLLFSTLDISNSEPFSLKVVKSHNFSTGSHFASLNCQSSQIRASQISVFIMSQLSFCVLSW